jgi:hypothetical protein
MKIYLKKFLSGQVTLIFTLACLALSPQARAVCQEGCDLTNFNTFLGDNALILNTTGSYNTAIGASALSSSADGVSNTAVGFQALESNTTGSVNTAIGMNALAVNTTGSYNTATGVLALYNNYTGSNNVANGYLALWSNSDGVDNTAVGFQALEFNTHGSNNVANGANALSKNSTGIDNTANGANALFTNKTGLDNTGNGSGALFSNRFGSHNTADGFNALYNNRTGGFNIALGDSAGFNTTGRNNIDIGNAGVADESNTIRIGTVGTQTDTYIAGVSGATVPTGVGVIVDANGHLGTTTSSARYKNDIKPMDKASEAILALKPVTFHYRQELDPEGIPQFGLVAEQVEKVNPDLVARDEQGKPYTVRYEAVNAMLLNEFLKEHRKVEQQGATIAEFKKEIANLTATVKEQAAQIQKVSAQVELSKFATGRIRLGGPAPRTVLNNQ